VPHLRLVPADGPTELLPLRGDRLLIGRARECDIILPDVLLSRRHAEIIRTPEGWAVLDLGSMNGTRLNGVRLEGERLLRDGDTISLADWNLVFVEAQAPDVALLETSSPRARLRDITDLATKSGVDSETLARQGRVLGVLTRAASAIVAIPTADALLDTLLDHLLAAVPARRGVVALFEGEPPRAATMVARDLEGTAAGVLEPAVADRVLRTRAGFLASHVEAEDGSVRSVLCAPLWFSGPTTGSDRVAGLVALDAPAESATFDAEHLQLVTAVTNLAASRLESVHLRQESVEKRRLEEDLRGAARIQASLLPEEVPSLEGWEIAGSSRLCSAVGADYYDFALDRAGLLLALGDVAGKGLAAALLMAALRAAVRALWREPDTLSRIIGRINENLCQTVPPNRYATLFLARLDTVTGHLDWVNAGHAAPIVIRAGAPAGMLEGGGTILGVFPDAVWHEGRTRLEPGDVLVVFSDGVIEAGQASETAFGPDRLVEVACSVSGSRAADILWALQDAAQEGLAATASADDHTFVVLKRTGGDRGRA
jgi:sigma-B regulation protein RsbU (phosphoserine phosphatase)